MKALYWAVQSLSDVPGHDRWLGPREVREQATVHLGKRRRDWRLGRWTAKLLLAEVGFPGAEILKATDGAPVPFLSGRPLPVNLSISHRAERAIAAVAGTPTDGVGCDLELVEPRRDVFVRDFFTADEQKAVDRCDASERDLLVTLIWSAKESALKLFRVGLGRDTRLVDVEIPHLEEPKGQEWTPLVVRDAVGGTVRTGYWRALDGLVATVVADQTNAPPRNLTARFAARGES